MDTSEFLFNWLPIKSILYGYMVGVRAYFFEEPKYREKKYKWKDCNSERS